MKIWHADILLKTNLLLGEGPLWHPEWEKYLYVDIEGKKVGIIDPVSLVVEEKPVGKRVGAVLAAEDNQLLVALQGSLAWFNFQTCELTEIMQVEKDKPQNRCNDGKCDAAGRLWIGTMNEDAKGRNGALYCFDGRTLQKKLDNRFVSNGICWSMDNRTMYYIDSFDYHLKAFDFDLLTGSVSSERIVVEMKEPGCTMDGMTMDEEGMIWIGIWGGHCVNRYNPLSGELIGTVQVNAPYVTSCCFGGANMEQLFITTARVGLGEKQLQLYPDSGSLFVADIGLKGQKINYFSIK
jgi:sugar lactone lactonase YvrE